MSSIVEVRETGIYLPETVKHIIYNLDLFSWVEALRPRQQIFSNVGTFSLVEPVLSNEDEVSCSRTQHSAPGESQTLDLAIKSPALYRANGAVENG